MALISLKLHVGKYFWYAYMPMRITPTISQSFSYLDKYIIKRLAIKYLFSNISQSHQHQFGLQNIVNELLKTSLPDGFSFLEILKSVQ